MKKSRESSHYFSRQYPRRRQIRLPARLQISGTMTMPQGSSRWEHTMGAALCSGHGRRRLHARQRQTPRSAGETSRAVFSSAPIAVFLIQKEKILGKAAQNALGKGSSPLILPKPFLISFFPTSKNGRKKTRKPLKLLGFSRRYLFWFY